MKQELMKTQAFGQMTGTGFSKGDDLTLEAKTMLNRDKFFSIFSDARPSRFEIDYPHFETPIKVGDYTVEFKPDGVQVGCTFVDKKTILDIAAKLK